jgi:MoaA/NifB/PqqE/SkfB family radical SAM enzyme
MKDYGFKHITLCGGEPTLNPYFIDIINLLYEIGLEIILYTNCIDVDKVISILDKINILSIPIDNLSVDSNLRCQKQYTNALLCMDHIQKYKCKKLKLKIGTVVSKRSTPHLNSIAKIIRSYDIVDHWRLYQFSPYGLGEKNRDVYEISDKEFFSIVSEYSGIISNMSYRTRNDNIGYCIIMGQNGDFYRYEENYVDIGMNIKHLDLVKLFDSYQMDKHSIQKGWINTII